MEQFSRYAEVYDFFNQKKPYKEEINFAYQWAEEPHHILDLGCGTAKYWKHFPLDAHLTGVDKSRFMRNQSRYRKDIIIADIMALPYFRHDFDCVVALFDVVNYTDRLDWFKTLPLEPLGFFVFDVWDKNKALKDGFSTTSRTYQNASRHITPRVDGNLVRLQISIVQNGKMPLYENHLMHLHSHEEIEAACGDTLEIVDIKETGTWQRWYKVQRIL